MNVISPWIVNRIQTMSLTSEAVNNPSIDNLIKSSLEIIHGNKLEWIPYENIIGIESTQVYNIHYARRWGVKIMLLWFGNDEECIPALVREFTRIYSLPTHEYKNNVSQYR